MSVPHHLHNSNALMCAKYCEIFQPWLEFEEGSSNPVANFIRKNIELLTRVGKEEMELWATFMRETSPMLYNRYSHEGGMLGSLCEFGRLVLKENLTPMRPSVSCDRLTRMMTRLDEICQCLIPIMGFLQDGIKVYGFVELIPLVRELYQGSVELLLSLRGWMGVLLATLNKLEIDDGHKNVSNFVMIEEVGLEEMGSAATLWGSTFTKFWEVWITTKTAVVEICHRCVISIIEGNPAEQIFTDGTLGMFVKVMENHCNVKRSWSQLRKELDKEEEERTHESAAATSVRSKFSWGNRLSQISTEFYSSYNDLSQIMQQTNDRVFNAENLLSVDSPVDCSNTELAEAAERVKTKLDLYVSCVDIISRSRKRSRKPTRPRPSPELLAATAADGEEEAAADSSDETSFLPEPGVFTNTSRNLMEGEGLSDLSDEDDFDRLSDEFFQSRGGNSGETEQVRFGDASPTDFTQATFRNVVTELKNKLTDVKESMDIREKKALKKSHGDHVQSDESSSDGDETVEDDFKKHGKNSGDHDKNREMTEGLEGEDSLPPVQPPDFDSQLRMVMSQLQQKETEEFECDSE